MRQLTKEILGAVSPLVSGRSITYAGSKSAHDAFATLQQQLEESCEQYRRLCQTNRETLTPSTSAALKAEQEELFFSICRQAEILLEDRRALLTDTISAASGGTWLDSRVPAEMDKAAEHLSIIGLTAENMIAFPSNPQVARRTPQEVITERLLSISGEDCLSVPRKFKDDWQGILTARVMVLSNELPNLNDASGALAGRMIFLFAPTSFYGREDRSLQANLERELAAIFHWAVEGYHDLDEAGGLHIPDSHNDQASDLERLSSPIKGFLDDSCEVTGWEDDWISNEEVYLVYRSWCEREGINHPKTNNQFFKDLKAASDHRLRKTQKYRKNGQQGLKRLASCDLWGKPLTVPYGQ